MWEGGYGGGDDEIEEDEAKMGSFSKLMSMVLVLNYTKKTDKIRDLTSFTSSFPHVTSTSFFLFIIIHSNLITSTNDVNWMKKWVLCFL